MNPQELHRRKTRPKWKAPEGTMSVEEIRWWMLELKRQGWTRGVMARTLGYQHKDWRKALGKEWIYPSEQVRFSRQLRKIISGELILRQRRNPDGSLMSRNGPVYDAILAAQPVPLHQPLKMVYDFKRGRLSLTPQRVPLVNPLPDFATAWQRIGKSEWRA